jgi:hypothetical protein
MKYIKLFTGTRRLGSMGSTTTNGKNHVLPINSGTPTEPHMRSRRLYFEIDCHNQERNTVRWSGSVLKSVVKK